MNRRYRSVCVNSKDHYHPHVNCPNCSSKHVICLDENMIVHPGVHKLNGELFRCQNCDSASLIGDLIKGEHLKVYKKMHGKVKQPRRYLDNICMICRKKKIYYDRDQNKYVCEDCGELYDSYDLY